MENKVYVVCFVTGFLEKKTIINKVFLHKEDAEKYKLKMNEQLMNDKLHSINFFNGDFDNNKLDDAQSLIKEKYGYYIQYGGAEYSLSGPHDFIS